MVEQRFLGHQHGFFRGAANADTENASGHQPAPMVGTIFSTQSTMESEGLSMANLDLFSEPPPLAATSMETVLLPLQFRSELPPVCCLWCFCARHPGHPVWRRAAYCPDQCRPDAPLVDHMSATDPLPLDIHSHANKHGDNAGVLANGTVTLGTHARVDQDLRHGIFGCLLLSSHRRLLRPE